MLLRPYDLDDMDNFDPDYARRMLGAIDWIGRTWFRAEIRGLEEVPDGPGLYVANHNGGVVSPDTPLFWAACARVHGLARLPYSLGHEVSVGLPIARQLLAPLRVVRADHENAARAFRRGFKVLVYPGGDLEAVRPWRERNRIKFAGRTGYARLAIREGVPIHPVVSEGGHNALFILHDFPGLAKLLGLDRFFRLKAAPLALMVPWGLSSGLLPYLPLPVRIQTEVLPPIHFERSGPEAAADGGYVRRCADKVERAMQAALTRMATGR